MLDAGLHVGRADQEEAEAEASAESEHERSAVHEHQRSVSNCITESCSHANNCPGVVLQRHAPDRNSDRAHGAQGAASQIRKPTRASNMILIRTVSQDAEYEVQRIARWFHFVFDVCFA